MKASFASAIHFYILRSAVVLLSWSALHAHSQSCLSFTCPSNILEYMPCGIDCLAVTNYSGGVATNYCDPQDLTVAFNPPPGTCFPLGTSPVVMTVSGSGQTNSCEFTVTLLNNPNCPDSLPVYMVIQPGAVTAQANALAGSLGIPTNAFILTNGQIDFLDPSNFMAAPVMTVTDPVIQSNYLAVTTNKFPAIPINFEQLDFGALNGLIVPPSNAVVSVFSMGLTNSGLYPQPPQSASPIVTHTLLSAFYTNNNGTVLSASNYLDTQVSYQLTLQGIPVIGPGAQVQAAFGPNGAVTRLHYAARQVVPGPTVSLISPTVASNLATAMYGGANAQITVQLVYYAPPLSLTTVSNLIPWYLCGGTVPATNSQTGQNAPLHLMRTLIPATTDSGYVPSVQLSAGTTGGGTQVVASARVSGGTAPYNYLWSGSAPGLWTNPGPAITYTPVVKESVTRISIAPLTNRSMALSWVDPLGFYQPQSAPALAPLAWSPLTNDLTQTGGVVSITLNPSTQAQLFRLALTNRTVPFVDTVGLWVVDHNGVFARTYQNLGVLGHLVVPLVSPAGPVLNWGIEAPYDQDFLSWDDSSWRSTMQNYSSVFGYEQFDRGEYIAYPLDFIAWPHGWAQLYMDTADITFYSGHGNPNAFTFTYTYGGSGTPYFVLWNNAEFLPGSWGISQGEWLALLSCQVLAQRDDTNKDYLAYQRWGPAFDKMHLMVGFETDASSDGITGIGGDSFETVFIKGMGGKPAWPLKIQQAWFNAALNTGPLWQSGGVGQPAALGPIGYGGVWDFDDYWWGIGAVGPSIESENIKGWFYMSTE